MSTAVKKVETILKDEFKMKNYVDLVREIFSTVNIVAPNRFNKEYSNFASHVEGSYHVGRYETPDGKKIAIFAVELKQQTYVYNSRSTQRSYAKKLIENGNCDAALIAFYTPGDKEKKWRLSFVRLDYEMKIENGKMKTEENLTPAKRYSYLVGAGEPCHTAIERFRIFITDNNSEPTLDELENSFSVEAVTKEFFELYCEKFYQLVEYLETNEDFRDESQRCGFTSEQFAKKLMGQIVFLYFLQKKGWLGVGVWNPTITEKEYNKIFFVSGAQGRIIKEYLPKLYIKQGDVYKCRVGALDQIPDDVEELIANNMPGDRNWGSGSRTFLRTLFEFSKKHKGHFYEEYLEPLFYDTLNKNRGTLGYSPILHCRIPFLSGGLFEPLDGYDWKNCYFDIPDSIFSNKQNENDLKADGILDIFDRYNFTMSEDEPMEREVAIDPEMLGKVFENLLDIKDRKSKGAFYTPREIVHYMCQESLVNYLTSNMDISEEAIRSFILYGDFYKDSDTEKTKKVTDANGKIHYEFDPDRQLEISSEIFCPKNGVNRINEIDELLKNIRVADPAVGSGAFPLGMLNEIVRARQNLSAYMATSMSTYNARLMYINDRSAYRLKYETIRNCIFAADIEPSAVDIAQLRLWLALVIDDEINPNAQSPLDGHRNPLPLPNLECNIICGNSLIDKFEGHCLIPQNVMLGTQNEGREYSWNQLELEALIPSLVDAQDRLFRCDDPMKKDQIKTEIEALKEQMIHTELSTLSTDSLDRYEASKRQTSKQYVLWQVEFARVFKEKGGFDVVIGNPPYIQLQKAISEDGNIKLGDMYKEQSFETFVRTGDIYCLFYEKGYYLLNEKGTLSFITSNKWMRAGYGKKLREFFANNVNPLYLIDFAGQKIFESATVDVNILIYEKRQNEGKTKACIVKENCGNNLSVYVQQYAVNNINYNSSESWIILNNIEHSIKQKIESIGTPLGKWNISINYGIKTGLNDAFIISTERKDSLIAEDPKSAEIIRPILRGRDIKRYEYSFANLWMIITHNGIKSENTPPIDVNDYPAIKRHLDLYYEQLAKRADKGDTPYNLRNCVYMNDFSKQKVIWGEISDKPKFAIDTDGRYCPEATTFLMTGEHLKYLLCFLNSKLSEYFFAKYGTTTGMGTLRWKKYLIELLPIPIVDSTTENYFTTIVDNILQSKGLDDNLLQTLDDEIFKLFHFTKEEADFIIKMVEQGAH